MSQITFKELGYSQPILQALNDLGFEKPTPIQEKTANTMLHKGHDVVALAQTGTGKTAAFGLPICELIEQKNNQIQALVLTPTRELCLQVAKDLVSYSKYLGGVNVQSVYGGTDISKQIRALKKPTHVVVATPGRLLDLINRKVVKLDNVKLLVLDEADEMLNMGFKEDIEAIIQRTPDSRRTMLFSATMPKEVEHIAKNYISNAEEITVGSKNEGTLNVSHEYYVVNARDRYAALRRLVDALPGIYAMVFCRTRAETKSVAEQLMNHGYNADALHGDLSQAQRDLVMDKFRKKHLQLLVATDVAARGIDVNDLTHVINYNLPDDVENYTHRSGRTGRAGKEGISVAIVHTRETSKIRAIEKILNRKFEYKQIPNGEAVCLNQMDYFLEKISNAEFNTERVAHVLPKANEKLSHLTKEDLIEKIVGLEFEQLLKDYKRAPDLNASASKAKGREDYQGRKRNDRNDRSDRSSRNDRRKGKKSSSSRGSWETVKLHLGKSQGVSPTQVIQMINKSLGKNNTAIGDIQIGKKSTTIELSLMDSIQLMEKGRFKHKGNSVAITMD